jgi:hypothetical protein
MAHAEVPERDRVSASGRPRRGLEGCVGKAVGYCFVSRRAQAGLKTRLNNSALRAEKGCAATGLRFVPSLREWGRRQGHFYVSTV